MMKKVILFCLALCLLALPVNAKKPKLARAVWFLFEKQDKMEKQPNDSIVVSYKTIRNFYRSNDPDYMLDPQPTIVMTIQNKSERAIYVDLQQSFVVINEELYPLYIPISEVSTTSSTTLTGVNLGLVGVGSAETTSNAKITHAERYITVPGETKKTMEIPFTQWHASLKLNKVDALIYNLAGDLIQNFINYGEVKHYEYDESPLTLDMRLCYSFNDNITLNFINRTVYYSAHIVGSDYLKAPLKVDHNLSIERALKIYPPLKDYLNSSNSFYLQFWTTLFPKPKE